MMFNYQEGSSAYRSAWGSCLSLLFLLLTLSYTVVQVETLRNYKATAITMSTQYD